MKTKLCSKCGIDKPFSEFHRDCNAPNGRHSSCKICVCKKTREYLRRPEVQERIRKFRSTNEYKHYSRQYQRTLQASHKRRNRLYGIKPDEFQQLLTKQNNCCAICRTSFIKTPCVDHCHSSGKIRGLLCQSCNQAIGLLKENPQLLDKAKEYLNANQ